MPCTSLLTYFVYGNMTHAPHNLLPWSQSGEFREYYDAMAHQHPCRTFDENAAMFAIACCYNNAQSAAAIAALPRRVRGAPYIIWTGDPVWHMTLDEIYNTSGPASHQNIVRRTDVQFASWDLRDYALLYDWLPPLPGVGMPPPGFFTGAAYSSARTPKYLLTFKGQFRIGWKQSSFVRENLAHWFTPLLEGHAETVPNTPIRRDKVVVYVARAADTSTIDGSLYDFNELMDTAYAIVPHGHSRWTRRLGEIIGAGAVPVILSDGYILPFSEIIDWTLHAVQLPETMLSVPADYSILGGGASRVVYNVLDSLPGSIMHAKNASAHQRKMRKNMLELNKRFFETPTKRWSGLLLSMHARINNST